VALAAAISAGTARRGTHFSSGLKRSHETYCVPRIQAGLSAEGIHLRRKRVARLMKAAGMSGVSCRKGITTHHTRCDHTVGRYRAVVHTEE
jgi:transposase InsO family protein